jgi:hypothetical protein
MEVPLSDRPEEVTEDRQETECEEEVPMNAVLGDVLLRNISKIETIDWRGENSPDIQCP